MLSIWQRRNLIFLLASREIESRYRQSILGGLWILVRPLSLVFVFTYIFKAVAQLDSSIAPYPVMVLTGLFCFEYFSSLITRLSNCFLANRSLVERVYCPRIIFPISAILVSLFDSFFVFTVLLLLIFAFGVSISSNIIFIPIFILLTTLLGLGIGLVLATVTVWFRDISHLITFVMQAMLLITPIGYETSNLPEHLSTVVDYNPIAKLVDYYRWSFYGAPLNADNQFIFGSTIAILIIIGFIIYNKFQKYFADVI